MGTTFNREDCKCGADHDTLESIVLQAIALVRGGAVELTDEEFAQHVADAAEQVGWTK